MAVAERASTETEVFIDQDESVETLREILAREQLEPVGYEEARALGYELVTFFEIFDEPSEGESDGDTDPAT